MEEGGLDGELGSFYPSAFGTHSSRSASGMYSAADRPTSISPESFAPYISFPATTSANASVTSGCHFGNSCYGCKVPQHTVNGHVNGQSVNKPIDMAVYTSSTQHHGEATSRLKEIAFYHGYAGFQPIISSYIDLPVVHRAVTGDLMHETCLPMEGHQHWDWSNNWSSQLYCSKDQTQSPHIWKPSLTDGASVSSFCQRGRKKRVPYTKLQLKELEREYTNTKFITKEKRRRIASSTNLSERQVTIWFQNRRVKDKKITPKVPKDSESY